MTGATYAKKVSKEEAIADAVRILKPVEKQAFKFFQKLADEPKSYPIGEEEIKKLAADCYGGDYEKAKQISLKVIALGERYKRKEMNLPEYQEAVFGLLHSEFYTKAENPTKPFFDFLKKLWEIEGIRGGTDIIHQISDAARIGIEALIKAIVSLFSTYSLPVFGVIEVVKGAKHIIDLLDPQKNLLFANLASHFTNEGRPGVDFAIFEKSGEF